MKKLFLILCLTCSTQFLMAQGNGKISGTVMDGKTNQPVEFATIALTDATGKTLNGTIADAKGKFTIDKVANGTYSVVVSFILQIVLSTKCGRLTSVGLSTSRRGTL